MPGRRTSLRCRRVSGACLALALLAFAGGALAAAPEVRFLRMPRDAFDVIPPEERVHGERGEMVVFQQACRSAPTEWARRRIVDIAVQEWAFFGLQIIDESTVETRLLPPGVLPDRLNPEIGPYILSRDLRLGTPERADEVAPTIAGYWSATPDAADVLAQQNRAWTGPGRNAVGWLQPWSAAFISWVMCEAGLGAPSQFERDISHRVYVDQAIRARDGAAPDAAFVAHDAGEVEVVPGDLLCAARGDAEYRTLADRRSDTGEFAPTHCDIVVKVDEAAMRILVIGGNVMESVSVTMLPAMREEGKFLKPIDEETIDGARTIFAHLKLKAPPIELNALDNSPTVKSMNDPRVIEALKAH